LPFGDKYDPDSHKFTQGDLNRSPEYLWPPKRHNRVQAQYKAGVPMWDFIMIRVVLIRAAC